MSPDFPKWFRAKAIAKNLRQTAHLRGHALAVARIHAAPLKPGASKQFISRRFQPNRTIRN
jgi:hypothetical protein